MSAAADAAVAEASRVLEYYDPATVANQAVAAVPITPIGLRQRGRTGSVPMFNPSKHPRGAHGRFAAGSHQQPARTGRRPAQKTPAEIRAFQKSYGLPQTGVLDAATSATMAAPPPQTVQGQAAAAKLAAAQAAEPKIAKAERRSALLQKRARARAKKAAAKKTAAKRKAAAKKAGSSRSSSSRSSSSGGSSSTAKPETLAAATAAGTAANAWNTTLSPTAAASPQNIATLQAKLQALGYDLGVTGIDGKLGPATLAAIKKLQADNQLPATGMVNPATINLLNLLGQQDSLQKALGGALGMGPSISVSGQSLSRSSAAGNAALKAAAATTRA